MFSQLRRFDLTDDHGRRARLTDLSIALLESDYPPVTRLFFLYEANKKRSVGWDQVRDVDLKARRISVRDLKEAQRESKDSMAKEVLLGDDILDALVLDLQNRRVTRANDLWLEEEKDQLQLRAADTSISAILRRLSGARFGRITKSALYDWKYVEFLRGDPDAVRNGEGYHLRVAHLPPGEIARLTDMLPYLHASELITLLPDAKAVDTLEAMSPERQLQVFEELREEQAIALLTLMAPDVGADLVARLPTKTMRRYLNKLPEKQAERLIELLGYPEDTVGGIMTNDVVYARSNWTVGQARDSLRELLKGPDFVFLVYIVDNNKSRRLRGLVSLRNLITAEDDQRLEEIMDPFVTTLKPHSLATEAAHRVIDSHMAALPVVGDEGELLGIVTVDAAIAQVAPVSWRTQAPRIFS
ncbi:MAG: CBS domain-containing protein [Acidobacteria bacterium]|nr:CBS domain-containing protein [Acidobacteriota bacterium]